MDCLISFVLTMARNGFSHYLFKRNLLICAGQATTQTVCFKNFHTEKSASHFASIHWSYLLPKRISDTLDTLKIDT